MAAGNGEVVVIPSAAGLIVMESDLDAVCERLSVTCTTKLATVAPVGVPLIAPAESVKPDGSVPDVIDQVYGAVPPEAAKIWL